MTTALQRQPVITVAMLTSLASAVIAGLTLWLDIPPDTEKVVLGIITATYPVVTAAITWFRVYSPATTERLVEKAYKAGTPPVEPPPPLPEPPGGDDEGDA